MYPELQKAGGQAGPVCRADRGAAPSWPRSCPCPTSTRSSSPRTGYAVMLEQKNTVEDRTRLENVRELLSSIQSYLENAAEEPSLAGFLDEIALYTDLDSHDPSEDCVVMMTMHSAKGLEFPVVFVVGVEEGIFPGIRAIGEPEEMEEERRLCYVAMTRAKEKLYLTCATQRMLFGRTSANRPSPLCGRDSHGASGALRPDTFLDPGVGDWGGVPSRTSGLRGLRAGGAGLRRLRGPGERGAFQRPGSGASYGGFTRAMGRRPAASIPPRPRPAVPSAPWAAGRPPLQYRRCRLPSRRGTWCATRPSARGWSCPCRRWGATPWWRSPLTTWAPSG